MKEKTTIILDASALKESSCKLRLFNNVVLGYKEHVNTNDIEFGQAFHHFRAIFRQKGFAGMGEGMVAATTYWNKVDKRVKNQKKYLDETFLMNACQAYAVKYQNDTYVPLEIPVSEVPEELRSKVSGEILKMIEPWTRFMFPYYSDDEVDVLMAGTMDGMGQWRGGGNLVIVDDLKTSGVWNITEYFESYNLSPQLMFYKWAVKRYIQEFPDSFLAKLVGDEDIGCMIDGVFYAGKDKPVVFQRSNVFLYKDNQIKELDMLINSTVMRIVNHVKMYRLDPEYRPAREGMLNGACQTVYGPCKFFKSCAAVDSFTRTFVLNENFKQKFYNPMEWGE